MAETFSGGFDMKVLW